MTQTRQAVSGQKAMVTSMNAPTVRAIAPQNSAQRLNQDSARVAPSAYAEAASRYVQQQVMPAPQYQLAEAADFSDCQVPQPIQIRVPQVTIRKHTFPVVYSTYDRIVSHETIEVPVQYQKVENPPVYRSMCESAPAMAAAEAGPALYGSCSKSSFTPNIVEASSPAFAPSYAAAATYGSPYNSYQNSYSHMM